MPWRETLFSINSSSSSRELIFLSLQDDCFTVELVGAAVYATQSVSTYTDGHGLASLLGKIAAYERPWSAAESWESLEGDFSISATCSSLGNVTFSVYMCGMLSTPDEWKLSFKLITELGQLPQIATNAHRFFAVAGI
jgi:hypothetical protein